MLLCLLQGRQGRFYARWGFMEVDRRVEKKGQECREMGSEDALRELQEGPKQPFNLVARNLGPKERAATFGGLF